MGVGFAGNNTTIYISGAISYAPTATGTVFTNASNEYAIVNIYVAYVSGSYVITVGGQQITAANSTVVGLLQSIYVGPSQALYVGITGSNTVYISGVVFKNSP